MTVIYNIVQTASFILQFLRTVPSSPNNLHSIVRNLTLEYYEGQDSIDPMSFRSDNTNRVI